LDTAAAILRHPVVFFQQLPTKPGYRRPLLFMAVTLFIDLIYTLILSQWPRLALPGTPGLSAAEDTALNYASLAVMPFLLYGAARIFGGKGRFQDAVAVIAYSCAALLLPPVRWLGYAFGFYGLLLIYIGAKEAFGLTVKRAVFACLFFFFTLFAASAVIVFILFHFLRNIPGLPSWLA
jgi:hypothetical protein